MLIYNHDRFENLLANTITMIKGLINVKGAEYSGDVDRLANFRRNGEILGLPLEVVWSVYASKHYDAIMQYIKDINEGRSRIRSEPISGRVDDLIVYLLLFKAILDEKNMINKEKTLGEHFAEKLALRDKADEDSLLKTYRETYRESTE